MSDQQKTRRAKAAEAVIPLLDVQGMVVEVVGEIDFAQSDWAQSLIAMIVEKELDSNPIIFSALCNALYRKGEGHFGGFAEFLAELKKHPYIADLSAQKKKRGSRRF